MKNKNSLIIVIVVLSVLIGLLGGYIISDKLIDKEPNNEATNNGNENNNTEDTNVKEENFDFELAKKLLERYRYYGGCASVYIEDLTNEDLKTQISIKNLESNSNYSCKHLYGSELYYFDDNFICIDDIAFFGDTSRFYEYDDVLVTKKDLFGNEEVLNKKGFTTSKHNTRYEYNDNNNVFVLLYHMSGYGCNVPIEYTINSAKIKGDELKINVIQKVYQVNTEATEENLDSQNEFKYIFNKNGDDFYLTEVNKIK